MAQSQAMTVAQPEASWPTRVGAFVAVALLHAAAVVLLIRAFAPGLVTQVVETAVSTFAISAPTPTPEPQPTPAATRAADTAAAGQSGAAGRQAIPREVMAPKPRVAIARPQAAPQATSTGSADSSGARDAGEGTGAGGSGTGTGSGGSGTGQGGGGARKAEKIAGDINSARDYPAATRDQRIGDHVVIYLTVGTDGWPTACRIARASRDAEADAITCRLALARFRFRPATDPNGQPVVSTYGWQQRWFYRTP